MTVSATVDLSGLGLRQAVTASAGVQAALAGIPAISLELLRRGRLS
jgi:hypothetical protein